MIVHGCFNFWKILPNSWLDIEFEGRLLILSVKRGYRPGIAQWGQGSLSLSPDGGCAEQVLESTVLLMSGVRLFADQQPAWPGQTVSETVSAPSHSSPRPARHHLAILSGNLEPPTLFQEKLSRHTTASNLLFKLPKN